MSRKSEPQELNDLLDDALSDILGQGWTEPVSESNENWQVLRPAVPELENSTTPEKQEAVTPQESGPVDSTAMVEYPPLPVRLPDDAEDAPGDTEAKPAQRAVMDVGLLADLAAGRKTALQAAQFAGVTEDEVQSSLALALRQVPPEEIAKAMGLQAAEQQLKSGAIYGVILADLMADMAAGRLKPETKIELAKLLARVGRVEPKEDKGAGMGNGFVLNINLGAGREPVIVDAN